jgi:sugar phosphate isomerase/epimerase
VKTIKGPAIYLAQFARETAPYDTLAGMAGWAASHGYRGIQLPTNSAQFIDLTRAAESPTYCDEIKGLCAEHGVELTDLSAHLQGQLVAVHPVYDRLMDGFAPPAARGNSTARQAWAVEQLKLGARASRNLGLAAAGTLSGAFLWPFIYPFPQRPAGLVEEGFAELARRWLPILEVYDEAGVDLCFELHPTADLHDGYSFEMFLDAVDHHPRARLLYDPSHLVLQQLDEVVFIDIYYDRISGFHVKDAEFRKNGRCGVYGGYRPWVDRAGRFRSLGDGQVDFGQIFSKLTHYGFDGWAVLEWECCLKDSEQAAAEGAPFIAKHIIRAAERPFDDFAASSMDREANSHLLGLG